MSTSFVDAFAGAEQKSVTECVLAAIEDARGIEPLEFEQPLFEVIDPDALDALFRHDGSDVSVEFSYLGYDVHVSSDGHVTVTGSE